MSAAAPIPTNLAYACSLYPSVAHVCRRIDVNRQQFNKYLAGQVRPSRHNMRKICDFFGVTESELLYEPPRFAELFSLRRGSTLEQTAGRPLRLVETLFRESGSLQRYLGCYYRYFFAFSHPGKIIKSFATLSSENDNFFWKNLEIIDEGRGGRTISKYEGAAFLLGERLHIIEHETFMASSITQLLLYPSYQTRIDYLVGVQTGGPTKRGRKPAASLVLLEYLGAQVDYRRALRQVGMFDASDVDPQIRAMISTNASQTPGILEADQI
ncbi:helix-turn-helix transcriptional regulator [Aurantimonas sp. VKM B-3413]|uniref:helix-turn-helix domain-containing protein n=1 Tax=Aurantimonas sp. VKM B-3413 TaxID=2779401 RepID=UPI001E5A9B36|nr:helix-turn-helix transcriptional regulator [Aurantimonas sp. VKM B-3413]MCB8840395.1 helix-turn-helix domain-containing protein [Aurantimonas sp. VKM B-3413]